MHGCSLSCIWLQALAHMVAGSSTYGCNRASSAFISAASDGAVGAAPPRSVAAVAGFFPHEAVGGSGAGSISLTGSTQWKVTRSRPLASRCDEIHARPCAAAAASRTVLSPMPLDRVLARPACSAYAVLNAVHMQHTCSAQAARIRRAYAMHVPCVRVWSEAARLPPGAPLEACRALGATHRLEVGTQLVGQRHV